MATLRGSSTRVWFLFDDGTLDTCARWKCTKCDKRGIVRYVHGELERSEDGIISEDACQTIDADVSNEECNCADEDGHLFDDQEEWDKELDTLVIDGVSLDLLETQRIALSEMNLDRLLALGDITVAQYDALEGIGNMLNYWSDKRNGRR